MDLNFVWGGGGEKNLVKAVFMSVYRRLAANSIQNQVKKRRCPKHFGQDCRYNLLTHPYNNDPAINFNGQSLKLPDECGALNYIYIYIYIKSPKE